MEHGHLNPTAFVTTIDPCYIKELPISGSAGIFNYVSVINYLFAHDPTCGCGCWKRPPLGKLSARRM